MAEIPSEYWRAGANSQTAAVGVARLNAMRDVLAQVIGLWAPVTAVISGGAISPWADTGETITAGAMIILDTEGGASTDDLDRIDPTGLLDVGSTTASRVIMLMIASAARTVRLRAAQGGVGQILLPGGVSDVTLDHPDIVILARWDPAASPRSWRVLGTLPCGRLLPWRSPTRLETWTTSSRPSGPANRLGWNSSYGRVEVQDDSGRWLQLYSAPDYVGQINVASGAQAYTLTHGLDAAPTWYTAELECIAPELGYAAGDRVPIAHGRTGDGSIALEVVVSATTVKILQGTTPRLRRADNPGSDGTITPAWWRYVVRAWR